MSVGVPCPRCRCPSSAVVDSRGSGGKIRRRRVCDKCKHRFSTVEVSVDATGAFQRRVREIETEAIRAEERAKLRDEVMRVLG